MIDAETSLRAALAYARLGWRLLPVGGDNGKRPLSEHGVKDATHDPERIRTIWPKRACNVGVAAGECSGFWVLDCDGDLGADTLDDLERRYGSLPHTIRQLTPSGGNHVLFEHVPGLRNRVRFAPGLDVRTDGGYIVAAPSVAPGKVRPWAWSVDHHPTETPLARAPGWLLELITIAKPAPNDEAMPAWLAAAAGEVCEGRRNDTLARVVGHLLRRNVDAPLVKILAYSFNATRCHPPLPPKKSAR